jgi:uncharacterized protein involved in exopolysaccharide biosynthesis
MDLGSLFVILAVFAVAAAFIARPLVERHGSDISSDERRISALKAERDQVLDSILEAEMDQVMGKLSPEDFQSQRTALVGRGAQLLKELAELEGEGGDLRPGFEEARPVEGEAEWDLEEEVKRLRRSAAPADDGFCGRCGKPVLSSDRFCTHCGASLVSEQVRA